MGRIKFFRVISFSSEDPAHPAGNLITDSTKLKWQCQNPGETRAFVTLQLDNPCVIRSVDIANNYSAFVEVLVGRPGMSESEYKSLLPNSSLMTPIDARNNVNGNRVRMFPTEKLDQSVSKEKWDILKIVCTQPFNSHIKYGVAFVAVHELDDKTKSATSLDLENSSQAVIVLGGFKLREVTELTDPTLNIGSMFQKLKATQSDPSSSKQAKLTLAEAMLKETEKDLNKIKKDPGLSPSKVKLPEPNRRFVVPPTSRNGEKRKLADEDTLPKRNRFSWDDENNEGEKLAAVDLPAKDNTKTRKTSDSSKRVSHKSVKNSSNVRTSKHTPAQASPATSAASNTPVRASLTKASSTTSPYSTPKPPSHSGRSTNSTKTTPPPRRLDIKGPSTPKPVDPPKSTTHKPPQRKPFKELLKGVVFAMSGFVNPRRSKIRDMAIEMGAKYRPDWDDSCTHLICAFVNTPKFNEVVGKGKIVMAEWVEECRRGRKRLPWRRYCLDRRDKGPESEDEIWSDNVANGDGAATVNSGRDDEPTRRQRVKDRDKSNGKHNSVVVSLDDEKEDLEKSDDDSDYNAPTDLESDDEISTVYPPRKNPLHQPKPAAPDFISLSDEDQVQNQNSRQTESNPKYFHSLSFYLDSELSVKEKIESARTISAHGGTVTKNLDRSIGYYVAWANDADRLKTVKMDFPGVKLVAPLWIEDCKAAKSLVSFAQYEISV